MREFLLVFAVLLILAAGCDEKPWVISGMEDGTSNPNTITHKGFTIHTVLDHDNTNEFMSARTFGSNKTDYV